MKLFEIPKYCDLFKVVIKTISEITWWFSKIELLSITKC